MEEAAEWSVVLMDDPADRELRQRFEAWRGASAENAAAWAEIEQTSSLATDVLSGFAHEWRPLAARHSRGRRLRRWLAPASVVLLAIVAWAALPTIALHISADAVTGTAELRSLRLEDGSTVTLAPESALKMDFTERERKVELLKGEAFFDIAADPRRPFEVAARSIEVSVLGTRFDVRLGDAGVGVAVEKGRVLVEMSGRRETLEAMQSIQVANSGEIRRQDLGGSAVATWRQGQAHLRDQPFADAIEELRPYLKGRIVVMDRSLAGQPTTGVLNLKEPEAALRGLAQTHGVRVRNISPWLMIVSAP